MLIHESRILTLHHLLVHDLSLLLKRIEVLIWIVSLLGHGLQQLAVIVLVNLYLIWDFRVSSAQLFGIAIEIIVKHAHIESIIVFGMLQVFFRNNFSLFLEIEVTLLCFLTGVISVSL
jgi:hypothetical protein